MFEKVLIARRGEAAARVARTCKRLGVDAIALYSDAAESVHVEACDRAFEVKATDGQVSAEDVIACAREASADAVFPGYSSHRAHLELAQALEAEGIPFVGLDPDVLRTVGDRSAFRELAERAGVRTIPGGLVATLDEAKSLAEEVDYPVVLKGQAADASIGARKADDEEELDAAWSEIRALQPEGSVVVESHIPRARDLEVLLVSDSHGTVLPLVEMETSILEAGRGLIRECPSPKLVLAADGESIREMMFDIGVRIARELECVGLMSVQMLLSPTGRLWVRGARLGLVAMHAVVERVTRLDLVALQLQVASGEALGEEIEYLQPRGHAIGAQILASDPSQEGVSVDEIVLPSAPRTARIELSVAKGTQVPPDDWPRVAKITASAPVRRQALMTLDRILAAASFEPLKTNVAALRKVLHAGTFRAGQYDLSLIEQLRST
ncbi:MAG: biotin carboxylase N-terminal domain-containing protein [Myxococcota bacterium]